MPNFRRRFAIIYRECRVTCCKEWSYPGVFKSIWNAFEASVLNPDRYFDGSPNGK